MGPGFYGRFFYKVQNTVRAPVIGPGSRLPFVRGRVKEKMLISRSSDTARSPGPGRVHGRDYGRDPDYEPVPNLTFTGRVRHFSSSC